MKFIIEVYLCDSFTKLTDKCTGLLDMATLEINSFYTLIDGCIFQKERSNNVT